MRITYDLQFDPVFHPNSDILTCTRVTARRVETDQTEGDGYFQEREITKVIGFFFYFLKYVIKYEDP